MTQKYSTTNDYTDEELLALYREALARISVSGQSYQAAIMGQTRTFTSADLREVREQIEWLEKRIERDEAANGGEIPVNFARFTRG